MTASHATDHLGIFDVARDLVELGRVAEAVRLLDEQAPDRLENECPACGATRTWTNDTGFVVKGSPCREPGVVPCTRCDADGKVNGYDLTQRPTRRGRVLCDMCGGRKQREILVDMIVPHDSRALGVRRAW